MPKFILLAFLLLITSALRGRFIGPIGFLRVIRARRRLRRAQADAGLHTTEIFNYANPPPAVKDALTDYLHAFAAWRAAGRAFSVFVRPRLCACGDNISILYHPIFYDTEGHIVCEKCKTASMTDAQYTAVKAVSERRLRRSVILRAAAALFALAGLALWIPIAAAVFIGGASLPGAVTAIAIALFWTTLFIWLARRWREARAALRQFKQSLANNKQENE